MLFRVSEEEVMVTSDVNPDGHNHGQVTTCTRGCPVHSRDSCGRMSLYPVGANAALPSLLS